nr:MAG TPA: hypothetical protein [Caudoviricetes sp.]
MKPPSLPLALPPLRQVLHLRIQDVGEKVI